ncbi:MAG: DinB family protein [bacterium]|nr:DinB family protein [bacterium]
MYTSIEQFKNVYGRERDLTSKVLHNLTDAALTTCKASDDSMSICHLGWHVAISPAGILNQAGLEIEHPSVGGWSPPEGTTAESIASTYDRVSQEVLDNVGQWNDTDLNTVKQFFGMDWPLGVALTATIHHEIHHRGQLSVMMRQAGLTVPSIYGPNREETAEFMKKMAGGQPAGA